SGQAVARAMGATPISNREMGLCTKPEDCPEWGYVWTESDDEAPLFLYVMEEARVQTEGEQLGEVGGRLVAEVIIGLLRADPGSILNQNFVSPLTGTSSYTMADMIHHAGYHDK
ncbi:MAG: hypothetical protein AAF543_00700, partial [Pseudomonadota bacterium]